MRALATAPSGRTWIGIASLSELLRDNAWSLDRLAEIVATPRTLDDAAVMLLGKRVPVSLGMAEVVLDWWVGEVELLALYDHFFPEQFAASSANPRRPYVSTPSEAEIEFLKLIDARLFPIYEDMVSLPSPGTGEVVTVPAIFEGFDEDMPLDERPPGWQALLGLIGFADRHEVDASNERILRMLKTAKPVTAQVDQLRGFLKELERRGGWLAGVALLARMPYFITGNPWLDKANGDIEFMDLTLETMDEAKRSYEESLRLWELAEATMNLLAQPTKFAEVVTIWNRILN